MKAALRRGVALALLWLATGAGAQVPSTPAGCPPEAGPIDAEQARAEMREARDRGFLWRVERDGRTSYLYGTLHIARRPWMFPGPRLAAAIAGSDVVALELDLLDPDIQRRLAAAMTPAEGATLPPALARRLRAQVDAACLAPEAMAGLMPEVQLAALTTLAARWDGLDPAYAIDGFLALYARSLGKRVVSLETPEAQVALLRADPSEVEPALDSALRQLEDGQARPMLVRIAQVWDEGRADELARYEQWCDCADTETDRAMLRRMLDERNPALAERIAAYHASGRSVVAAVGALHMIGPQGLPALLAARGYDVQRVDLGR